MTDQEEFQERLNLETSIRRFLKNRSISELKQILKGLKVEYISYSVGENHK